jgi:hypothetical protein
VVYGYLRTSDAVSTTVPGEHVLASIAMFSIIYLSLFGLWLFVTNEKIRKGPEDPEELAARKIPSSEHSEEGQGLVTAAASLGRGSGHSLTESRLGTESEDEEEAP